MNEELKNRKLELTAIILIIISLFFWPLFIVSIPFSIVAMIESIGRNQD
jgi:hypothetical protein